MLPMQNILDELTQSCDPRLSLFDVQIQEETDGLYRLSGRVLERSQLDDLQQQLSTAKLDLSAVRVLREESHARMHVTTNLTGLYERPTFGMPLSSELTFGTELEILDEQGRWVFTRQNDGYLGWAYRSYLAMEVSPQPTHVLIAPAIALRKEPDSNATILTRLVSGTKVRLWEQHDTWSRVEANQTGWLLSTDLRALNELPADLDEKRTTLIEDAQRMIGVPYLWGGVSGNGIDCSGFARLVHTWVGVNIPRDADFQHRAARPVEPPFEVGDLLFFGEGNSERHVTHVGISLGGWEMIHSSRRHNGVYIDNVQEPDYLREIFMAGGSFLR